MRTNAVLLISIFALAGCVNTSVIATGAQPSGPPVPRDSVRVFLSERDAPRDMVTVATVSVGSCFADELQTVRSLQKAAAKLGANGIIVTAALRDAGGPMNNPQSRGTALAIYSPRMPPIAFYDAQHNAVLRYDAACLAEPSSGAATLGGLTAGKAVSVAAVDKGWAHVTAGDRDCFVELDRLVAPRQN